VGGGGWHAGDSWWALLCILAPLHAPADLHELPPQLCVSWRICWLSGSVCRIPHLSGLMERRSSVDRRLADSLHRQPACLSFAVQGPKPADRLSRGEAQGLEYDYEDRINFAVRGHFCLFLAWAFLSVCLCGL
jgi:hypothetical protein